MSAEAEAAAAHRAPRPGDRQRDRRCRASAAVEAIKQGEVGSLPVIVGLILIVGFFYSKNSNFLSAGNFTNLMTQMAGVTMIAIGVVFVLLLGEIDLSIGYVAGIAGVVVAELQLPGGSWEIKGVVAIVDRRDRYRADRRPAGIDRRLHRGAVFRRHARRPALLAGRHPLSDRRPGRDRDPGQHDQQRRQLLLQQYGRPAHSCGRNGALQPRHDHGRHRSAQARDRDRQHRPRRAQARRVRGRRLRRRHLGEQGTRASVRVPARDRSARLLDVRCRAHDVRPSRLRRRWERRGGSTRRHQCALDQRSSSS